MSKQVQPLLNNFIFLAVFLISLLVPRFSQIERPITVDELTWLTFSADFYYGLAAGDYPHTYQDHHPGVTTMLAGTGAFLIEFRAYRGIGPGYVENDTFKLIDLLKYHGIEIFDLLVTARQLMALSCVVVLLFSFWYLQKTFGNFRAFALMMFVALDPFTIGQDRLFSHEGLMSALVLLTWVSFFHYLKRGKHWSSLILSGIAAGFAALTKITSLGILPVIGLFWLIDFIQSERSAGSSYVPAWKSWAKTVSTMLIWVSVLILVFIAVWPAMWANPVQQIIYLVNHTLGFSGLNSSNLQPAINFSSNLDRIGEYLASIWSHPTLITWLGIFILVAAIVLRKRVKPDRDMISISMYSFLYNLVVLLVISIAVKSIKGPRYMSSVQLLIAFSGGVGYLLLLDWLKNFRWIQSNKWASSAFIAGLLLIQTLMILPSRPYYYTYTNPLRTHVWWNEHGAFLDQAADYLAQKTDAEQLTALTYSPGSFMFFFPGKTLMIVPVAKWGNRDVANLEASDYLIIDHAIRYRENPPRIIEEIADVEPEHIISDQGRNLVWIYRVADLPPDVFIPDP